MHCKCLTGLLDMIFPWIFQNQIYSFKLLFFFILGTVMSLVGCELSNLKPEFLPTPSNVTYTAGDLAILFCAVKNLGSKYVSWRKTSDPSPLTVGTLTYVPDTRFHVKYLNYRGEWNLYIKNVSQKDAGLYECQISTELRDDRKYVLLNVKDKPTTTTESNTKKESDIVLLGPESLEMGSKLEVSCNVSTVGYDPYSVQVEWFMEGLIIRPENERINISTIVKNSFVLSTLTINRVQKNDTGEFLCKSSYNSIARQHIFVLNGVKSSSNTKRGTDITETQKKGSSHSRGHCIQIYRISVLHYMTMIFVLNSFLQR